MEDYNPFENEIVIANLILSTRVDDLYREVASGKPYKFILEGLKNKFILKELADKYDIEEEINTFGDFLDKFDKLYLFSPYVDTNYRASRWNRLYSAKQAVEKNFNMC